MKRKTGFVNREAGKGQRNPPLSASFDPPAVNPAGVVVNPTALFSPYIN